MGKVLSFGHSRVGRWLSAFLGCPAPASLKLSTYAQPVIELGSFVGSDDYEELAYEAHPLAGGAELCTFTVGGDNVHDDQVFEVWGYSISSSVACTRFGVGVSAFAARWLDSFVAATTYGRLLAQRFIKPAAFAPVVYFSAAGDATVIIYGRRLDKA